MSKKASNKAGRRVGMSERTKMIVLVSTGCVMLLGASYWAYRTFTTVPPPSLETSPPQKVVEFLGNPQGYPRMSINDRERYLTDMYARFAKGESRDQLARSFAQMTSREKEVFVNTTFEAFKVRALENAGEFSRLPRNKQTQYVDKMIATFESQRQSLGGSGGSDNLGEAFKGMVPTTSDGWTKAIVTRTNARQRAKVQPLFDAVGARYKELRDSGRVK